MFGPLFREDQILYRRFSLNLKFKAGWKEYLDRLQFFLLNRHKEKAFILCFMKFKLYPLNDGEIVRKKLNNGCLENAHLLYYKRYNKQRENEENNHYEPHYTYITRCATTCHMCVIEEDITFHQYIHVVITVYLRPNVLHVVKKDRH